MKLTRNIIFLGIIIFSVVANILITFDVQKYYLREIFSILLLTIIPGLLIMLALKIRKLVFWEYLVYIVGLSISFLIFSGLLVNIFLPFIGITKPLSLPPLLNSMNILFLVIGLIGYLRNKDLSLALKIEKTSPLNKILYIIPISFPILSILGAVSLNNNSSNIFTMIMLGIIAFYVLLLILFNTKIKKNIFPWATLIISISMLLMYSLRSWHISGWDINNEFRIFQNTKNLGYWSFSSIKDTYNSCLSLTILPTIYSVITKINDEYIFKIVYQIIFSFVPVAMYCLFKKYSSSIVSFLASFFFISQPSFIQPMPALARQEIAFIFFTISILTLFMSHLSEKIKYTLFVVFGFSMVVSHYSTTYVALFIYLISYFIIFLYRKTKDYRIFNTIGNYLKLHSKGRINVSYNLKIIPILLITIFAFIWGTQLTNSGDDLFNVVKNTVVNMKQISSVDLKSGDLQQSLAVFSSPNTNTLENIQKYNEEETIMHSNINQVDKYSNFENEQLLPVSSLITKSLISTNYADQISKLFAIIKLITKIFVIIGIFCLFYNIPRKRFIDLDYFVLSLMGVSVVLMMYILPVISEGYNLARLYLQVLVMLSFSTIYAGFLLFKFLRENIKIFLVGFIFILFFLHGSGFIFQIIGGNALMQLNNFGNDYDKFYTHEADIKSAMWLSEKRDPSSTVFADQIANLKLNSFSNIDRVNNIILPSVITKSSYVYSDFSNIIRGRTNAEYKNITLVYTYPLQFLNNNKNLIYSNGSSEVFK